MREVYGPPIGDGLKTNRVLVDYSLFSPHVLRFLILAQSHKLAVPKVAVRRPFDELELSHQLRLEPPTFQHLRGGQTRAPAPGLFLGQIPEGAFLDFEWLDLFEQFRSRCWSEAGAGPGC